MLLALSYALNDFEHSKCLFWDVVGVEFRKSWKRRRTAGITYHGGQRVGVGGVWHASSDRGRDNSGGDSLGLSAGGVEDGGGLGESSGSQGQDSGESELHFE